MGADSFIKSEMHRMPTYDEILYDTVLNPTARINLPDRRATQMRSTHQLTRFDEVDETPNLAAEQEKITKARLRNEALAGMGGGPAGTAALGRANLDQERRDQAPPPQPPSASNHYTREKHPAYLANRMQVAPIATGRNFFMRGLEKVWYAPRKEPFKIDWDPVVNGVQNVKERAKAIDWNPMFTRIQEARDEVNEINMARARLKGLKAEKAEKAKQAAADAEAHLIAGSASLGDWLWPAAGSASPPQTPPPSISIATPPASVASSRKARSEPLPGSIYDAPDRPVMNMKEFMKPPHPVSAWLQHGRSMFTM